MTSKSQPLGLSLGGLLPPPNTTKALHQLQSKPPSVHHILKNASILMLP